MQVTNISVGPRGIWNAVGGLVTLEPGETQEIDLGVGEEEGEWFKFGEAEADGLAALKVADLKALAEAEGIDLGDASKKADIISAIELAREAA